jgi:glucose-6-phosphate 1-epimerase
MNSDLRAKEIPGVAAFVDGLGGLAVLEIHSPLATARIFLHGAQLTAWQPAGLEPVIFTSAESLYEEGKAIRGGVPVCFPWFGPRDGQPAHGFVRNKNWSVESLMRLADGAVRATFVTASDDATLARWPHAFVARLTCTVGATLTMELEVENTSAAPFTFSEALHTYFVVGDARQASVTGLESTQYRDFPDRSKLSLQSGPIQFTEETDRVYVNTRATCVLHDPVMGRRIVVEKSGSDSTTVWNPWIAKSAALADFGDDEWLRMVCIETVNAAENSVTVAPGERHRMTALISVEKGT